MFKGILKPKHFEYLIDFCVCQQTVLITEIERFLEPFKTKRFNELDLKEHSYPVVLDLLGEFICNKCNSSYEECKCREPYRVFKFLPMENYNIFENYNNVKSRESVLYMYGEYCCSKTCLEILIERYSKNPGIICDVEDINFKKQEFNGNIYYYDGTGNFVKQEINKNNISSFLNLL